MNLNSIVAALTVSAATWTACPFAPSVQAGDVTAYGIAKGAWHSQTSPAGPDDAPGGYGAFAYVAATPQKILIASVTPSGGFVPFFLAPTGAPDLLVAEAEFPDLPELNDAVPDGPAAFTLFTTLGTQLTGSVNLTGAAYPPGPVISNFPETQDLDPAAPFTLRWNAFPGAGVNDFVVVQVSVDGETVLQTPLPGQPGALAGSATSVELPPGLVATEAETEASVAFIRTAERVPSGIDGGVGYAAYYRTTAVILKAGNGGGGGGDTTAPSLASSLPATGSVAVDPAAAVVFTFSEPMQSGVDATWLAGGTVLAADGFQYAWSPDGRVLTCIPVPAFPAGSQVAWALGSGFRDLAGNALPAGSAVGFFETGGGSGPGDCHGTDLNGEGILAVTKLFSHFQADDGPPVPDSQFPAFFSTVFRPPVGLAVTAANVTPPGKPTETLIAPFGNLYLFNAQADTAAALEDRFPAGSYSATITTTPGPAVTLGGTLPASTPNIPRIANLPAARSIDPAQPFTLRWEAFAGAAAGDYLVVEISEVDGSEVFAAPDSCKGIDLPATATEVVIPAGTLVAGRSYEGRLIFHRLSLGQPQGSPPIRMNLGLGRSTRFPLGTGGGVSPAAPRILNVRHVPAGGPGGALEFDLEGSPNGSVQIEASTDLDGWTPLTTVPLSGAGTGSYQYGTSQGTHRYFRARAN